LNKGRIEPISPQPNLESIGMFFAAYVYHSLVYLEAVSGWLLV